MNILQLEDANRALLAALADRESAQAADRRVAERQQAILNALPQHIALVDTEGMVVFVNRSWRRYASVNELAHPDICVGQNYLEMCERAVGPCCEEAMQAVPGIRRVLQGQVPDFTIAYHGESPIGRRWFQLTATALQGEQLAGAVIVHDDITDRRQGEQALALAHRTVADSEQRLAFALQAADIGSWDMDLRTNVARRSLRHDQCFGYDAAVPEWGYDTFLAHIAPVDRDRVDGCFREAMAGRGEYDVEFRVIWRDNSEHWLWSRGRFYFDDAGLPNRVAGIMADVTERKSAVEALRASETRFAEAFEQTPIGLALLALDGRYLKVNHALCALIGYPEVELLARTFHDITHADDLGESIEILRRLIADSSRPFQIEKRYVHANGHLVTALVRISLVRDDAANPLYFISQIQDITERKQAEKHIKRTMERLTEAQRIAQIGDWEWDIDGNTVSWSPQVFEILGRDPALGAPQDLEQQGPLFDAASGVVLQEHVRRAIATGEEQSYELVVPRPGGARAYVQAMAVPKTDETGRVVSLYGTIQDISARKKTEARLRRLIDSNAQGVFFWNRNGDVTGANDVFLHMVGSTSDDVDAGRVSWTAMTPPEYADLDRHAFRQIAATGTCTPFEKEILRKDGSRLPVLVGATRFEDEPDEGLCFAVDITERKKLEQQFFRAQRMESIGTLASGIAHDLNNALAPILMSLDLLRMQFPDEESQELLAIVSGSAQHGADLVRQVLLFARGVKGQRVEVGIGAIVRDIEKIMRDTFLKHIRVRTIVSRELWTVLGDPTQLHQVLLNLCVNARDAMPEGGTLTLVVDNVVLDEDEASQDLDARPGPYVSLQVEDSGSGILPADIERIFDPFFTTKEVGKGTGLGLSTSLAIVRSHGGFIRVSSELTKGTRFRVFLPAQTEPASATDLHVAAMPRGDGELILVVDDEPSVRQITKQTLEAFGYRVALASDGSEAVSIFASRGGDIAAVLTDMMMPIMDGPATIGALRKLDPAVRIIGASGLGDPTDFAQSPTIGVTHFLEKPYSTEVLLTTLRTILAE